VISPEPEISSRVLAAAQAGNLIEAIKLVREETGLGLREAKELVEGRLAAAGGRIQPAAGAEMPVNALVALQRGQLIEAIRHFRVANRVGLKDAKEAVEAYLERNPLAKRQFKAAAARRARPVLRVFWFLVVTALAVAGYFLVKG